MTVLGRRFFKRQTNPPVTFIFIPFAFLSAILGGLIFLMLSLGVSWMPFSFYDIGAALLFQGFIMFLLLGVGGFLIRSILGWGTPLPQEDSEGIVLPRFTKKQFFIHLFVAVILLSSFFVESISYKPAYIIRACAVTFELFWQIKIHRRPRSGKLTAYSLQLALWLLVLGLWGMVFFPPTYRLAFLHLCFVGGFALSVFSVATRVIFSHCGYASLLRRVYLPLNIAVILMLMGLVARFSAEFFPDAYFTHLTYAGLLWAAGVSVWMFSVFPKIIRSSLLYQEKVEL